MIDNNSKEFIYRHIGPSEEEQKTMLKAVGYSSLEDLMENTVPEKILLKNELKINDPLSENCLLYTSPSPRDGLLARMPSSA